ncbi:hypothetical protein ACRRTK_001162 [Alexandromys fortis]
MVQCLTYRRRLSYNTASNKTRLFRTPGNRIVYLYTKKVGKAPKSACGRTPKGLEKSSISTEEKSKQIGNSAHKDSAVQDSEVSKPRSSVRRTTCPCRNRMSLEYELYSVPSEELPMKGEESFRSRKFVVKQPHMLPDKHSQEHPPTPAGDPWQLQRHCRNSTRLW